MVLRVYPLDQTLGLMMKTSRLEIGSAFLSSVSARRERRREGRVLSCFTIAAEGVLHGLSYMRNQASVAAMIAVLSDGRVRKLPWPEPGALSNAVGMPLS
jgi:hypothetical protein